MAFPAVQDEVTDAETSNVTSHTVALPASPVSGETLLVLSGMDGGPTMSGFSAGWAGATGTTTGQVSTLAYWKQSDGTEGGTTFDYTTGAAEKSASVSFRVNNAEAHATQAPESASTNHGGGAASTYDPPNLTPTGGSKDYLWFAWAAQDGGATGSGTYPTSYTNGNEINSSAGGDVTVSYSRRELAAASENPGSGNLSASQERNSWTVAIHPGAGGPATTPKGVFGLPVHGPLKRAVY
jgi:hypothetical protein